MYIHASILCSSFLSHCCSSPSSSSCHFSRIHEIHNSCSHDIPELNPSDEEKLLKDCALEVESKVQQIVCDCSDVGFLGSEDLDAYIEHLKEELNNVQAESTKIVDEIEGLDRTYKKDSSLLEVKLEELECSLDFVASKAKASEGIDYPMLAEDQSTLAIVHGDKNMELLELDYQIDEKKSILKSLEDLQSLVNWFDTVEQMEDVLTGVKVLAFDENCISLSLQTYLPKLEGIPNLVRVDYITGTNELNHELLIEVIEGSMKLKNVQVFPNDIYVNDIFDTAKSLSKSLQWFIRKVQDRIILSTLRRLVVNDANKSRYSLEYSDRDEHIMVHMNGGIDAFIKLSQGWPMIGSPLKLISLKHSDKSKGISLSFLCKVEELANSSDAHTRQNISSFVDAIEKILIEQMKLDLAVDT